MIELFELGRALQSRGSLQEAMDTYRDSLEIHERRFGETAINGPILIRLIDVLAEAHEHTSRPENPLTFG